MYRLWWKLFVTILWRWHSRWHSTSASRVSCCMTNKKKGTRTRKNTMKRKRSLFCAYTEHLNIRTQAMRHINVILLAPHTRSGFNKSATYASHKNVEQALKFKVNVAFVWKRWTKRRQHWRIIIVLTQQKIVAWHCVALGSCSNRKLRIYWNKLLNICNNWYISVRPPPKLRCEMSQTIRSHSTVSQVGVCAQHISGLDTKGKFGLFLVMFIFGVGFVFISLAIRLITYASRFCVNNFMYNIHSAIWTHVAWATLKNKQQQQKKPSYMLDHSFPVRAFCTTYPKNAWRFGITIWL